MFPSPNFSERRGGVRPDLVVIHYTAMASCAEARARLAMKGQPGRVDRVNLNLQGGIHFNGQAGPGNIGASLGSASGAVVIRGGGAMDAGSAARGAVPGGMSESGAPSVLIDGTQNVTVRSEGVVTLQGPTINVANAGTVNVGAQNTLTLSSGGRVSLTTQSLDQVISGRESTNYGGPHEGNPANGPSRTVTFSSTPATGEIGRAHV